MYHTKQQDNDQIDSGIGDSFGSFNEEGSVTTIQESLQNLNVDDQKQDNETQIVQFLRQAFTPDEDNDTYLHLFIARGLEEKAMQLVEVCPTKEILDIQNNMGQTALHVATYVNFYKVSAQLIQKGADIEYVDKDGRNVFHLCAERGHLESLEAIARLACQTKQISKLKRLLNERDFHGLTPFYLAVANRHQNICKKLVDMKVDVNLCDSKNGNSPLHEAVLDPEYSQLFIEFLIKICHVDVNYQNFAGVTPLHCAAGRGDTSLFAMLMLRGGNTNIVDIGGNTPVVYGNREIYGLVHK